MISRDKSNYEFKKRDQLIWETLDDLIVVVEINNNNNIKYINEKVYKSNLGYTRKDLIGKSLKEIIDSNDAMEEAFVPQGGIAVDKDGNFYTTDKDFDEKVIKSKTPILVDFWAPWCGPCKMAEPALEELSEEYKDKVEIVKVNIDENQDLTQKYQVMSVPTTILFKDGEEVGRQIGFAGKQGFEDLIKKAL